MLIRRLIRTDRRTVIYDKELRKERLSAYLELWPKLISLARYSAPSPVGRQLVMRTSEAMRDWYFDTGGIYLSRESRGPYFELKGTMQYIIDNPLILNNDGSLTDEWVVTLHRQASELRTSLSDDVGTRQEPSAWPGTASGRQSPKSRISRAKRPGR
jgi:hypothetical protein